MSRENANCQAVMEIAANQANSIATFKRCYAEVPNRTAINGGGAKALSQTRPGEPMWHQLVRNIRSLTTPMVISSIGVC